MKTINIIGHTGCAKCKVLRERIDKILEENEAIRNHFITKWWDTEAEDLEERTLAWMEVCQVNLNPNQAPCFVISDEKGNFLPSKTHGEGNLMYPYLGIRTDYFDGHGGVIKPTEIKKMLQEVIQDEENAHSV